MPDTKVPTAPASAPPTAWWRQAAATPMSRARAGILIGLVGLTAASWWYLLSGTGTDDHAMAPTMGLGAPLFLAVWIAMMVATMFPAVAPMVLMFARIAATQRSAGKTFVSTWLFVAGYLLLWTGLGLVAFLLAVAAEELAVDGSWIEDDAARIGGALIVLTGVYQFTSLKDRCLTECRSPMAFVMQHWRPGRIGAVRMGIHHGWHCAGCCIALMAVMFPLGMMNIAALAAVTAIVFWEKVLPYGPSAKRVAGIALVAFGLAVLAAPDLLPGTTHEGAPNHSHA